MSVSTCMGDISRVVRNTCVLFFFAGLIVSGAAVADVKAIVVNGLGNEEVFLSDINNKSQAVGSGIVESTGEEHALVWEDGESMDLGTLGGSCSTATAIDEGGEHIVGNSDTPSSPDCFLNSHAFIWRNGMMTDLGTLGGPTSSASDVNKNGVVAGTSEIDDCESAPWDPSFLICINRAFRWHRGTMVDLGTLGGANSFANHINNRGVIGGASQTGVTVVVQDPFDPNFTFEVEEQHATVWENGAIYDVHPPGVQGDSTVVNLTEDGTMLIGVFLYDFTQPVQTYRLRNGKYELLPYEFVDAINEKNEIVTSGPQSDGGFGPLVIGPSRTTELPSVIDVAFEEDGRPWFGGWFMSGMNNRHQAVGSGFKFFLDTFDFVGRAVIYDYTPGENRGKN